MKQSMNMGGSVVSRNILEKNCRIKWLGKNYADGRDKEITGKTVIILPRQSFFTV